MYSTHFKQVKSYFISLSLFLHVSVLHIKRRNIGPHLNICPGSPSPCDAAIGYISYLRFIAPTAEMIC